MGLCGRFASGEFLLIGCHLRIFESSKYFRNIFFFESTFWENLKMVQNRLKFNLALDNLASKLVSALVENQIKLDQGQFHSCFTQNQNSSQSLITSQNKRNKGILKSQNKQNYSPFPLGKSF